MGRWIRLKGRRVVSGLGHVMEHSWDGCMDVWMYGCTVGARLRGDYFVFEYAFLCICD